MERPRAGVHYPRWVGELQAWFRTDADCLDYLEWLRWPAGFVCPAVATPGVGGWEMAASSVRSMSRSLLMFGDDPVLLRRPPQSGMGV
jgi:hypothetical protein